MGLPTENLYKTDLPITIPEFSENDFENNFFENINPKNPKKYPLKLQNVQNIVK